jgi:hypothetical protein
MSIEKNLQKMRFDVRLAEWNLSNQKITKQELQNHLESLPDESDKAEKFVIENLIKRPGKDKH